MFAAVIALISCVGAWVAWHRHPLYSTASTFRVIAELLLVMIAGACIFYGALKFTDGRSSTVQTISMIAVTVLLTLAFIFSITAITTPKGAKLNTKLPPTVPLVNMYRRRVLHFLKISLVFLAIVAATCIVPEPVRYIAASLLAVGVLLGAVMLPTAYVMARRFDRAATAMTLNPWLHWHYADEEWRVWRKTSVQRLEEQPAIFVMRRDWRRMALVAAGVLTGCLLLTPGSWSERIAWAAACVAMVAGFVELVAWDGRRAPRKLAARLEQCSPEAYFGGDGMMCDGLFFTWLGVDVYLVAAGVDERAPRSLLLQFEKIVPAGYGSPNVVKLNQGVLIPSNSDPADLTLLRAALSSRCPAAKLTL